MGSELFWRPSNAGSQFIPKGQRPTYVHPYEDMASAAMPLTMTEALKWAQYIVATTGPYRAALRRVVAYCITDPEILQASGELGALSKEVRENYENILSDRFLQVKNNTLAIGMDLLTYGNVFVSVMSGFTRYLFCKGKHADGHACTASVPLKEMLENKERFKFQFKDIQFQATCPYCGYHGPWKVHDQPSKSMKDIFIHRWNPLDISLLYDPFAKDNIVVWNIPADYRSQVLKGTPHLLQTVPGEILEAIRSKQDFKFNPDAILHLKTPGLSGMRLDGWGLPGTISDFRQAWMYQTCNRHTETTAMESLAPMRILSPPTGPAGGDQYYNQNAGKFTYMMKNAIEKKRRDPSAWFVTPFPVQYQTVGGDASQFIPRDLMEFTLDNLLTAAGVPVEMYKGSMTIQAAPVALRLFTSYWQSMVTNFNTVLQFIVRRVSEIMGWEPVEARFTPITQADDMNRQMQALQLMQAGLVSKTTGLASVGIDNKEEVRRMADEQRDEAEQQDRMQKELETNKQISDMVGGGVLNILNQQQQMEQQAQGGGAMPGAPMPMAGGAPAMGGAMPQGGAAMAAGGGMSSLLPGMDPISQMIAQSGIQPGDSIQDIYAKAQTLAQQFMAGGNTASALRKLKREDKDGTLHMLVKEMINQMRSNASSQGRDMVIQQEFGGGQ